MPKILGKVDKIYNFLTERWLIADEGAARLLATVLPAIKAGNIAEVETRLTNETKAYATTPYLADRWELDDGSLPANSVAVINLEGPLYSWETFRLEKLLIQALNNDKIAGIVLVFVGVWITVRPGKKLHPARITAAASKEMSNAEARFMVAPSLMKRGVKRV